MSATLHPRARTGFYQTRTDPEGLREPIRQSLTRYYPSRDDATRTRGARRATRARRQARALKAGAAR